MADLEKVLNGLEACVDGECAECRYRDTCSDAEDFVELARDALELLKSYKPRVLTLDELNQDFDTWYLEKQEIEIWWLETKKAKKTIPASTIFMSDNEGIVLRTHFGEMKYFYAAYNKYWRCWSSRPTDEERKAVAWE